MAEGLEILRRRRAAIESSLAEHRMLHTLSAARFQLHNAVSRAIGEFAFGEVLEAGAGRSPFQRVLEQSAASVTTLDISTARNPDIVGDVQDMRQIGDATFDTVLATQVLEHVPEPHMAMQEFQRVLRPGGVLILSAPHLSMIHEAPNDYFRFTHFGFQSLCEASGLAVHEVRPIGGLMSLVGHLASSALFTALGVVPGLFWPVWLVNYVLLVRILGTLDSFLPGRALLPRDYLLVARRSDR